MRLRAQKKVPKSAVPPEFFGGARNFLSGTKHGRWKNTQIRYKIPSRYMVNFSYTSIAVTVFLGPVTMQGFVGRIDRVEQNEMVLLYGDEKGIWGPAGSATFFRLADVTAVQVRDRQVLERIFNHRELPEISEAETPSLLDLKREAQKMSATLKAVGQSIQITGFGSGVSELPVLRSSIGQVLNAMNEVLLSLHAETEGQQALKTVASIDVQQDPTAFVLQMNRKDNKIALHYDFRRPLGSDVYGLLKKEFEAVL